jgi:predicted RNase H-like HicB family nuclease
MKSYLFKVIIEQDENAYHAYCPALKGCHTWGYTQQESLKNIKEAVEAYIMSLIKHGEEIPVEPKEQVQVLLEPLVVITV